MKKSHQRGFGFVETLVAVGIVATVLVGLLGSFHGYVRASLDLGDRVKANFLAEEGLEALRILRDEEWSAISSLSGQTAYLSFDGSWAATATPEYLDGFARSFSISPVMRNGTDDIVESGGTDDPYTKKATVQVAWSSRGATTTVSLSTYFADIHE